MLVPDNTTKVEMSMFKQAFDAIEAMIKSRCKASHAQAEALSKLAMARAEVGQALLTDQEQRLVPQPAVTMTA